MMADIDKDRSGTIYFEEFMYIMTYLFFSRMRQINLTVWKMYEEYTYIMIYYNFLFQNAPDELNRMENALQFVSNTLNGKTQTTLRETLFEVNLHDQQQKLPMPKTWSPFLSKSKVYWLRSLEKGKTVKKCIFIGARFKPKF